MAWREDAQFGEVEVRKLTVNGTEVATGVPDNITAVSLVLSGGFRVGGASTFNGAVTVPTANLTVTAGNLAVSAGTISAGGNISSSGGNIVASTGGISAATFAHITPLSATAINALTSTPNGTIVIWDNSGTLVPLYRSGSNWKKLSDNANQTVS